MVEHSPKILSSEEEATIIVILLRHRCAFLFRIFYPQPTVIASSPSTTQ